MNELKTVHHLKTWPEFYRAVECGVKRFEIRKNDRGFGVGHKIVLQEYDPSASRYTGRQLDFVIDYLTPFLQQEGYVVMGISPCYTEARPTEPKPQEPRQWVREAAEEIGVAIAGNAIWMDDVITIIQKHAPDFESKITQLENELQKYKDKAS